jgi:bacteriocin-like protein
MDQDEQKQSDEEIKREKEANDSEMSDKELENVAGGGGGPHGSTGTPVGLPNN